MTRASGMAMFPQLLGVAQYLESHPMVTEVKFFEKAGAVKAAIQQWETANAPYPLPDDLKGFLSITDGLLLRWSVDFTKSQPQCVGNLHVNSLSQMVRHEDESLSPNKAAFVLDNCPTTHGRVCLVYDKARPGPPSVFFQSLDGCYHFVSDSFTDYFRLLIMHLGLPGWCYAFTKSGLPSVTEELFAFFSPERYLIDVVKDARHPARKQPPVVDLNRVAEYLDKGLPKSQSAAPAAAAGQPPVSNTQSGGAAKHAADARPRRRLSGR